MIAVIADIHGDHAALKAVLDDVRARGITRIWCLGDIVGSAGNNLESWRMVKDSEIVLAGNWDLGVQSMRDSGIRRFGEDGQGAIKEARNYLVGDEQYMALKAKQQTILGYDMQVIASHASPAEPYWEFVNNAEKVRYAFNYAPWAQLIVLGHHHKPLLADSNGTFDHAPDEVSFRRDRRYLLNPGPVLEQRRWLELDLNGARWHQLERPDVHLGPLDTQGAP